MLCAGGTGNPFFTTDTAAVLRALELDCDIMLKATKVDGVYDSDPVKNPDAVRFEKLTYDEIIRDKLGIMDLTAVAMAADADLPIGVFNLNEKDALKKVAGGDFSSATIISGGKDR